MALSALRLASEPPSGCPSGSNPSAWTRGRSGPRISRACTARRCSHEPPQELEQLHLTASDVERVDDLRDTQRQLPGPDEVSARRLRCALPEDGPSFCNVTNRAFTGREDPCSEETCTHGRKGRGERRRAPWHGPTLPVRVAMLTSLYPQPSVGGIQSHTFWLSRALAAKGAEVHVVTRRATGHPAHATEGTLHVHRVSERRPASGSARHDRLRGRRRAPRGVDATARGRGARAAAPVAVLRGPPPLGLHRDSQSSNPHACGAIGDVGVLSATALGRLRLRATVLRAGCGGRGSRIDVYPLLGAAPGPRHPGADEMVARTRYHRGLSAELLGAQLHWLAHRPRAPTCARGPARSAATSAPRVSAPRARGRAARGIHSAPDRRAWAPARPRPLGDAPRARRARGEGADGHWLQLHRPRARFLHLDRAMLEEKVREARFVVTIPSSSTARCCATCTARQRRRRPPSSDAVSTRRASSHGRTWRGRALRSSPASRG